MRVNNPLPLRVLPHRGELKNSPPLEGWPQAGVVVFSGSYAEHGNEKTINYQPLQTTPSGSACHPSTGGEFVKVRG